MTYLRPSRRRGRNPRGIVKIAIGLGILIVLLILNAYPPQFLGRLFLPVAKPLWALQDATSSLARSIHAFFTDKPTLQNEIETLRAENETLKVSLLVANEAAIENVALRALGGRSETGSVVFAAVLSRPPVSPYDTVLLDVGSANGIAKGNVVTVDDGVVIGTITDVLPHSATVSLLSTPGRETGVLVGSNKIPVPARGKGGGNFEVRVPKDQTVVIGDTVVAPGMSPKIMGVVGSVEAGASDPFSLVRFTLPINLFMVRFVSVLP